MSPINVIVAYMSPGYTAESIADAVAARSDMKLVARHLAVGKVDALLDELSESEQYAIILEGPPEQTKPFAERWLEHRADIVVLLVELSHPIVRIAVRDPRLDSLLAGLRGLVEQVEARGEGQVAQANLRSSDPNDQLDPIEPIVWPEPPTDKRVLLEASIEWIHKRLREAVARVPDENGDVHGLSVTKTTLLQSFDSPIGYDLTDPEDALDRALDSADPRTEPLATLVAGFALNRLEFRMLLLGLAPELDPRFQRCIGFLLDEMGRRVGTLGLYSALLGPSAQIRGELLYSGALGRALVFEESGGHDAAADEPLRVDPFLAQWLLGDRDALSQDPRLRRILRLVPWLGARLLDRHQERIKSAELIEKLLGPDAVQWVLLTGYGPAGWRALVELGAGVHHIAPIRIMLARVTGLDVIDVEDCARRVARLVRLTGRPLIVDSTRADNVDADDDGLRTFFATLRRRQCHGAVIGSDHVRIVRHLGTGPFEVVDEEALTKSAVVEAIRVAANNAEVYLSDDEAAAMANRYPLQLDGLDIAMSLARSRPKDYDADDAALARFTGAMKEVSGEELSNLAQRIEPLFNLDDVVLPPDRKQQLNEIVDNVRLAPQVLDEWKFRAQLPYGRGVSALFFGPSGVGKTMAAIGIARRLGIQILRFDLSKVVSKYIGDTEKNIDRVFSDAERSGSAILIDEADALMSKRSEVKDAHDRYANIEVAYLLQRMESYDGLAILTTNMRQSLDPAFLRRLRFIVEFPRPDVETREQIWRQCLPEDSHTLDAQAFRQLARRIDVTGGHIRQITLRAAFIAAAAGVRISIEHIAQAVRAELAKLGMPPVDLDVKSTRRVA